MEIKKSASWYGVFVENEASEGAHLVHHVDTLEEAVEFTEHLALTEGRAYFVYDLRNRRMMFAVAAGALLGETLHRESRGAV